MPAKKYRVTQTTDERDDLKQLLQKERHLLARERMLKYYFSR
jgi:hypothetical protein